MTRGGISLKAGCFSGVFSVTFSVHEREREVGEGERELQKNRSVILPALLRISPPCWRG